MPLFDEEPKEKPPEHRIGEVLDRLSVGELGERVELLKAEIVRLEAAIRAKQASRDAASSFFKR